MTNPFVLLGLFIAFSFWWLDRALAHWKKEQDKKLDGIKKAIEDIKPRT